jgi:hypothetical protein
LLEQKGGVNNGAFIKLVELADLGGLTLSEEVCWQKSKI